jgi:single-strand DNA-binding protein
MSISNSFNFIGRLVSAPEVKSYGDKKILKFVLIRNEYAGKTAEGDKKERVVTIQFTAFGRDADAIATNSHKGDQLAVNARIENNNYQVGEETRYGHNFVVENFEFCAPGAEKRQTLSGRNSQ